MSEQNILTAVLHFPTHFEWADLSTPAPKKCTIPDPALPTGILLQPGEASTEQQQRQQKQKC
jgi:hypothetical protein